MEFRRVDVVIHIVCCNKDDITRVRVEREIERVNERIPCWENILRKLSVVVSTELAMVLLPL